MSSDLPYWFTLAQIITLYSNRRFSWDFSQEKLQSRTDGFNSGWALIVKLDDDPSHLIPPELGPLLPEEPPPRIHNWPNIDALRP